MRFIGGAITAVALAWAPAATAKDATLGDKSMPIVAQALGAIQAGDPARGIELIAPVLTDFEQANAGKSRIYCADTVAESAYYLVLPGSNGGASGPAATPRSGATIEMNSVWCMAQYIRAFALVDLKRLDEAQATYERLIEFAPRRSRYLNELGFVLQQKRQWQASIDMYTRSDAAADLFEPAVRDRERCVALRGIGYDLVELGRLDDAEAAYRKCLAITPNEPKSLGEIEYIRQQRRNST